jgi:hypothetical protein
MQRVVSKLDHEIGVELVEFGANRDVIGLLVICPKKISKKLADPVYYHSPEERGKKATNVSFLKLNFIEFGTTFSGILSLRFFVLFFKIIVPSSSLL